MTSRWVLAGCCPRPREPAADDGGGGHRRGGEPSGVIDPQRRAAGRPATSRAAARRRHPRSTLVELLGHPDGGLADHEQELLVGWSSSWATGAVPSWSRRGATTAIPTTKRPAGSRRRPPLAPAPGCWSTRSGSGTGDPGRGALGPLRTLALDAVDVAAKAAPRSLHRSRSSRCPTSPETRFCWARTCCGTSPEPERSTSPSPLGPRPRRPPRAGRRPVGHRLAVVRDPEAGAAPGRAPRAEFRHGLEVGCSTGALAADLAHRCHDLLVVDASDNAVAAARNRLGRARPRARRTTHRPPRVAGAPGRGFDLIVLSEVGYFLSPRDLDDVVGQSGRGSRRTASWCCVTGATRSWAGRWTVRLCTRACSRAAYVLSPRATAIGTSSCSCSPPGRASRPAGGRVTTTPSVSGLLVVIPARDEEALVGRCLERSPRQSTSSGRRGPTSTSTWSWWRTVASTAPRTSRTQRVLTSCRPTWAASAPPAGWGWRQGWRCGRRPGTADVDRQHRRRHPGAVRLAGSPGRARRAGRPARPRSRGAGPGRPGRATWQRWQHRHTSPDIAAHVHGANLGFGLDDYLAAGGWSRLGEREDRRLVDALLAAGDLTGAGLDVVTSGRLLNRVPGGFAGYLRTITEAPPGLEVD